LSYIYIPKFWRKEKFHENYQNLTNNKYYNLIYKNIEKDFIKTKKLNVDYIFVLILMGSYFNLETDSFQKKLSNIFSNLGADFIIFDIINKKETLQIINNTFILNGHGDFSNSNIESNAHSNFIVDLYFNRNSKSFIGSSIIPMYIQKYKSQYFRSLPIFKIFNNSIKNSIKEMNRVKELKKKIIKTLIGKEISISDIKEKYFFINGSYKDIINNESKIKNKIKEKYKNKKLFKLINNSYSISFIGDSITEGAKNNLYPWYEPLIYSFDNKKIINISKGDYTILLIIKDYKYHIMKSKSNLYIIALGTNDINYRDENICAMTKEEYINNIRKIIKYAKKYNDNPKFVLIAPWVLNLGDKNSKLNEKKKILFDEYANSLNNYCIKNNHLFINPNPYIYNNNITFGQILENKNELYSEAVLYNSE
jgi:lysophospholipase L1-like esterase